MKKNILLNMVFSLIFQLVTVISGVLIPRLILETFGSEVNGLLSSLNQLLNFITLLEGGISSVMMASLYKPLIDHDKMRLSSLVKTISSFFKRLSMYFIIFSLVLGVSYQLLITTPFSWIYVFSLTIILSINLLIQYLFAITYKLLLDADNKIYFTAIVQIICTIINTIAIYYGLYIYPDLRIIKMITSVVYIIQPIGYHIYVRKHYKLTKYCSKDKKAISQRWDGFGINFAAFIHTNTDIVILTIFTDLLTVSVYAVYHIVFNGIKSLTCVIMNGFSPTLGKLLGKNNIEELNKFYQSYELLSFTISTILFLIGSILILPFVEIYTSAIIDTNYYQPVFAYIMMLAEFIYCIRIPYLNLAYQSGHFKDISKYAYIEALLNISISMIFVNSLGLIGVSFGTLAANIYRTIVQVFFSKKILNRNESKFIKLLIVHVLISLVIYTIIKRTLHIIVNGIENFIIYALLSSLITISVFIFIAGIVYRSNINKMLKSFRN